MRVSVKGPLKDDDSRMVLIQDALYPLLAEWRLRRGGEGTVVTPMRSDGKHLDAHTVRGHLTQALKDLKLAHVTAYQATRHTFASHWVLAGNSLEKLREIMGHSTVQVTEWYSHIRPDLFAASDRATIKVDLSRARDISVAVGHAVVTDEEDARAGTG